MYGLPDSVAGHYAKKMLKKGSYTRRSAPARGITYGYKLVNVTIDKGQLHLVLNTRAGNLWDALDRRGRAIVSDAKKRVGVKTGALRSSIHMRHLGNATGQYLWIGSKKHYAYAHHEGTRPHVITPDKAPLLVFRSGTRVIKTPIVNHPGTRPNPYLTAAMRSNLTRPIIVR
jgi:hypothetical protein